jgi:hypothetical protein
MSGAELNGQAGSFDDPRPRRSEIDRFLRARGTLGNELAQEGIKVVILEAGPRVEIKDFINNEWESFAQFAWTDMRTTSGDWRVAKDFPNLPA